MTHDRLIEVLKTLLQIDNIEIIKYAIESLMEELQDSKNNTKKKGN